MDIHALTRKGTSSIMASTAYRGVLPELGRTAFEAGGSELAGFLIGRYSDTLQKTSVPVPLVAGAALKIGGIVLDAMTQGRSRLASAASVALNGLGSAGMNAFFVLDGVARGYASKDEQFFLGKKGAEAAKLQAAGGRPVDRLWGETSNVDVGAIPQAPADGQWFDEGGLRHFANS